MATMNRVENKVHVEPQRYRYCCKICKKSSFFTSVKLRIHLLIHDRNFLPTCVYCRKKYKHNKHLVEHLQFLHLMTKEDIANYLEKQKQEQFEHRIKENQEDRIEQKQDLIEQDNVKQNQVGIEQKQDKIEQDRIEQQQDRIDHFRETFKPLNDKDLWQFSCNICGEQFCSRKILMRHMRKFHPLKDRYFCSICNKGFKTCFPLVQHMNFHRNVRYNCKECNLSYPHKKSLWKHMKTHTGTNKNNTADKDIDPANKVEFDDTVKAHHDPCKKGVQVYNFLCGICNETFADEFSLKSHLNSHEKNDIENKLGETTTEKDEADGILLSPEKEETRSNNIETISDEKNLDISSKETEEYHCFECNKVYASLRRLEHHIEFHYDVRSYKCQVCSEIFETASTLVKHSRRHLREHKCIKCGKSFQSHGYLKEHMLNVHGGKAFSCKICRMVLPEKEMKAHLKMHRTEDFRCKVCGKSFPWPDRLMWHMGCHTESRNHKCKLCSKTYKTYLGLRDHMAIHKNGKRFSQCEVCGKSVPTDSIKQHMISHSDVKNFQCHICSKCFKMKHQLKSHLLTHEDTRKYECEFCGFKFKMPHHLRNHLKTHKT